MLHVHVPHVKIFNVFINKTNSKEPSWNNLTKQRCNISCVRPSYLKSLNWRSIRNKPKAICYYIATDDIDLLALTDTLLGLNIDHGVISELLPNG